MTNYEVATGHTIPFYQWMIFGVPLSLLMLVAAWLLLTFRLGDVEQLEVTAHEPWTVPQKRTLTVFGLACLAWITREIPFGGWSELLNTWLQIPNGGAGDMTVAVAAALALFLIPSGNGERGRNCSTGPPPPAFPGAF